MKLAKKKRTLRTRTRVTVKEPCGSHMGRGSKLEGGFAKGKNHGDEQDLANEEKLK